MPALIIVYLVAAYFFSWWPFDDTERAINTSDFNVYFYTNEKEKYLGQVNGLPACQSIATNHALASEISNWSYICCRIDDGSSCKSKHR